MERLAALKSTAHIHITSFHGGRSRSPLGSTILKRRQVPSIVGIELVSVQYIDIIDSHIHNHNRMHLSVKVKAKSHLLYQLYCTYAYATVARSQHILDVILNPLAQTDSDSDQRQRLVLQLIRCFFHFHVG